MYIVQKSNYFLNKELTKNGNRATLLFKKKKKKRLTHYKERQGSRNDLASVQRLLSHAL